METIAERQQNEHAETVSASQAKSPNKSPHKPSRLRIGRRYRPGRLNGLYDAIIIGSGIGGLTAGTLLSAAGKKVLVLEQHYTAGGMTHAYDRNGYEWDVGVHYIGDVGDRPSMSRHLYDFLSAGALKWAPMEPAYDRIIHGDKQSDLVAGREEFIQELLKRFPDEEDALREYLKRLAEANRFMPMLVTEKVLPRWCGPMMRALRRWRLPDYVFKTTREVLLELTDNEELIAVLTGQWGDNGMPPSESSFVIHAMIARHYLHGAYYPVGGSSRIAETIIPQIQSTGGEVFTYAEVETILLDGNRARGVRMKDGTEIEAPIVISGAGVFNTFEQLLPHSASERAGYDRDLKSVEPSMSHLCLYIGLQHTAEELGLPKTNYWVYSSADYDRDVKAFVEDMEADFPLAYISFPSAKDPDFLRRYPGRATIEIVTPAHYEWFKQWEEETWGKRGEEYDALKEKFSRRMLEKLFTHFPHLRDKIDYYELSTPLSTKHFCAYGTGEIYGLQHGPSRWQQSWLRPKTRIKGLYLTGQDIVSCGVGGAMFGGVITAQSILGLRRGLPLLRKVFSGKKVTFPSTASVAAETSAQ
ncbi:phytoene desaturase family protein [Microbulbifer agarilyticus]